jgi:PAS domain S-box-containing protein
MAHDLTQILLIEDNPGDARLVQAHLADDESFPHRLHVARSLADGLALAAQESFDVALLDLNLPDASGVAGLERLRAECPTLPIVVLTGVEDETLALRIVQIGAQDYVAKDGVTGWALAHAVNYAIERQRLIRDREEQKAELEASERRFRQLVEHNADGIVVVDGRHVIQYVNPAAETLFGREAGQFVGQVFGSLIIDEESAELDILHSSGEPRIAEIQRVSITWEGRPATLLSLHDVTERKRTEKALKRINRAYRVASSGNQAVIRARTEEELLQRICETAVEEGGYRLAWVGYVDHGPEKAITVESWAGEAAGYLQNISLTWSADDCHGQGPGGQVVRSGKPVVIHHLPTDPRFAPWRANALKYGFASALSLPLMRGGEVFGTLGIYATEPDAFDEGEVKLLRELADDLAYGISTLRMQAERHQVFARLAESQGRLQALFEHAQDGILLIDDEARFVAVNPAAADLIGCNSEEIIGTQAWDLTPPSKLESGWEEWRALLEDGDSYGQYTLVHKDGIHIEVEFRAVANITSGLHLAILRDITDRKRAEEALRQSEERHRSLFNRVPIGLYRTKPDGQIVDANPALVRLLGYEDMSELLAVEVGQIFVDADARRREQEQLAAEGVVQGVELQLRRRDGKVIWVEDHSRIVTDEDGQPLYYEGSLEDITHRKQAEQALQQRAAQLALINDISKQVTAELELDALLDRSAPLIQSGFGYQHVGLYLLEDGALVLKASASAGGGTFPGKRHLALGADLAGRAASVGEKLLVSRPGDNGGGEQPCTELCVPIRLGESVIGVLDVKSRHADAFDQNDAAVLAILADEIAVAVKNARLYQELEAYSEYLEQAVKERTAELLDAKESIEAIYNSVGEAIMVVEPDGTFRTVNPAFEQQTGYRAGEVAGIHHTALLRAENTPEDVLRKTVEAMRAGRIWRGEMPVCRKDGTSYDAAVTITPLRDAVGGIVAQVGTLRDITRLKEIERMKDSFVSTAAHELRTPLTSIRGFSEMLLIRDIDPEREKRYLRFINEQAEQLASIIDDLLNVSRLEAGKGLDIQSEPVDIGAIIREVAEPFVEASSGHTFVFEGLEDAPAICGDPFRLAQVVRNLLANAVKYSPDGGQVTLRVASAPDAVTVDVVDEGIGMTHEQQHHLFEKFYRADTSISGTGLGLSISRLIVEKHGGTIQASSQPGEGSVFTFHLPRGKPEAEQP